MQDAFGCPARGWLYPEPMSIYSLAADAILIVHSLFVAFVVVGQALIMWGAVTGWGWVRHLWFRLAHLGAIGFVVIQAWLGEICPLTEWENALRQRAGESSYDGSFIAHWLGQLLYYDLPPWVFVLVYSLFGGLVVLFLWIVPPRRPSDTE